VWRWALAVELGLSPQQLSRLSAVLLVHQDMTAVEVRHDSSNRAAGRAWHCNTARPVRGTA
jgi:hypothetical protein